MRMPGATLGLFLTSAFLAGCAPRAVDGGAVLMDGSPAGFWAGLWHGFIVLFTFIIALFRDGVGVYEVNNNGSWYDFGYLLGLMIFFGGGGKGSGCRWKRRD